MQDYSNSKFNLELTINANVISTDFCYLKVKKNIYMEIKERVIAIKYDWVSLSSFGIGAASLQKEPKSNQV